MFKWNEKSVKADVFERSTQQITRGVFSPREIVANPIGKQSEVIIMACAKILSEMIEIKEEEAQRVSSFISRIQVKENAQLELNIDV
jgi:hypothetical protein